MKKSIFYLGLMFAGVLFSCKPEIVEPEEPEATPGATEPSSYYISYDLDGASIIEEHAKDNYSLSSSNDKSIDAEDDYIEMSLGSGFYNFSDASVHMSTISFNNHEFSLSTYSSDEAAALASIFTVGEHPFQTAASGEEGVTASVRIDGEIWSTDNGTQSASSIFNVTESKESSNGLGEAERKVKGTFSCTFYNEAGDSKSVENGKFHLLFTAP